jgi:hypothetical protein
LHGNLVNKLNGRQIAEKMLSDYGIVTLEEYSFEKDALKWAIRTCVIAALSKCINFYSLSFACLTFLIDTINAQKTPLFYQSIFVTNCFHAKFKTAS